MTKQNKIMFVKQQKGFCPKCGMMYIFDIGRDSEGCIHYKMLEFDDDWTEKFPVCMDHLNRKLIDCEDISNG